MEGFPWQEKLKYYHLSDKKGLTRLTAKVPETQLYEDAKVKRVCFAPSIDQCLAALCGDGKIHYVYTPKDPNIELYKPTHKQVFDMDYTGERWSLEDIDVQCIGVIINKGIQYVDEYEISRKPYKCMIPKCLWEWKEQFTNL